MSSTFSICVRCEPTDSVDVRQMRTARRPAGSGIRHMENTSHAEYFTRRIHIWPLTLALIPPCAKDNASRMFFHFCNFPKILWQTSHEVIDPHSSRSTTHPDTTNGRSYNGKRCSNSEGFAPTCTASRHRPFNGTFKIFCRTPRRISGTGKPLLWTCNPVYGLNLCFRYILWISYEPLSSVCLSWDACE